MAIFKKCQVVPPSNSIPYTVSDLFQILFLSYYSFDPDPTVRHTFWCLFVGNILRGFSLVFNQSSVQRISATATISAAKKYDCL